MWTLQVIEPFQLEDEAKAAQEVVAKFSGYLGGSYGDQSSGGYYVQAFFRACTPDPGCDPSVLNLPDGAKHVFVPEILQRWYGFKEAE